MNTLFKKWADTEAVNDTSVGVATAADYRNRVTEICEADRIFDISQTFQVPEGARLSPEDALLMALSGKGDALRHAIDALRGGLKTPSENLMLSQFFASHHEYGMAAEAMTLCILLSDSPKPAYYLQRAKYLCVNGDYDGAFQDFEIASRKGLIGEHQYIEFITLATLMDAPIELVIYSYEMALERGCRSQHLLHKLYALYLDANMDAEADELRTQYSINI